MQIDFASEEEEEGLDREGGDQGESSRIKKGGEDRGHLPWVSIHHSDDGESGESRRGRGFAKCQGTNMTCFDSNLAIALFQSSFGCFRQCSTVLLPYSANVLL